MYATVYSQELNTSGYGSERSVLMCVGRSVHIWRFMECGFDDMGRETVVSCDYRVTGPCDGSCQEPEHFTLPDDVVLRVTKFLTKSRIAFGEHLYRGRVYDYTFCGSDLHIWQLCLDGLVHASRSHDATGTPDGYEGITRCDGSCKPRRIRLPPGAVKLVRKEFPKLFPQSGSQAIAKSA